MKKKFHINIKMQWVISYSLIIGILMIACIVISEFLCNIIEKQAYEMDMQYHNTAAVSISDILIDNRKLIFSLNQTENLKNLILTDNIQTFIENEGVQSLIAKLNSAKLGREFIEPYIYVKDTDCCIFSGGVMESKYFYRYLNLNDKIGYEEWLERLNSTTGINEYEAYGDDAIIMYTCKVNQVIRTKRDLVISTIIPGKVYFEQTDNATVFSNSNSLLFDSNGMLVMGNTRNNLLEFDVKKRSDLPQGEKKYFIFESSINFEDMKWELVTIVDKKLVLHKANKIRLIMWGIFIIQIGISVLIAHRVISYNYAPINEILDFFENKTAGLEFDIIKSGIRKLVSDNNSNIEKANSYRKYMQNVMLDKLLHGNTDTNMKEFLALNFIDFKWDDFVIVCSSIAYDEDFEQIKSHITEWFGESVSMYSFHETDDVFMLINCCCNLDEFLEGLRFFVYNSCETKISLFVSQMHKGYENISQCYIEAVEMYYMYRDMGGPAVYLYEENKRDTNCLLPEQEGLILINLQQGKYDVVQRLIEEIFASIDKKNIAQSMIGMDIICMVSKTAQLVDLSDYPELRNRFEFSMLRMKVEDVGLLKKEINELYKSVCEIVAVSEETKVEELAIQIKEYINTNYSDPNLSLTHISEEMGISSRWISKVFKDVYNFTILTYVNGYRLEKSKEFLDRGMNISETCISVGYINVRTFERLFKGKYGESPAKYRERL